METPIKFVKVALILVPILGIWAITSYRDRARFLPEKTNFVSVPLEENAFLINCEKPHQFYGSVTFRSQFYLDLLNNTNQDKAQMAEAQAQLQIKYLWGLFNHSDPIKKDIAISVDGSRISEIKELTINTSPSDLLKNADQLVTFSAEIPIVACNPHSLSSLKLKLPLFPTKAYELVDTSNHREISYFIMTNVINPCSHEEYADIMQPHKYWYSWDPDKKGLDKNGKSFNCKELLLNGRHVYEAEGRLTAKSRPHHENVLNKIAAKDKINVLILAGALNRRVPIPHGQLKLSFLSTERQMADPNFLALKQIVREVSTIIDVKTTEFHENNKLFRIDLKGAFKKSKTDVNVSLFFGYTNVLKPDSSEYVSALAGELGKSDLVFYLGHSGLGNNFNLNLISQRFDGARDLVSKQLLQVPNQFFGIISCYANSYFGSEILQARKAPALATTIMTTWSNSNLYQLIPAVFLYLDEYKLTPEKAKINLSLPQSSFVNIAG